MRINLETYKLSKKFIQETYISRYKNDLDFGISFLSAVTYVPVIVCAFYIGEVDGWSDKILNIIDRMTDFYGYKEILGIPESYPDRKI